MKERFLIISAFLFPLFSFAQVIEEFDTKKTYEIEAGAHGKTQTSTKDNGIGLKLDALAPFTKLNTEITSISPGTINGKRYLDLDVKLTAMLGSRLVPIAAPHIDMAAMFLFLMNVQGQYKQDYLGKTLSLAVGPFYFGLNSEGEWDANKRLVIGLGGQFGKTESSDYLMDKFASLGSVNLKQLNAKGTLILPGHLKEADVHNAIQNAYDRNPEDFVVNDEFISSEDFSQGRTLNIAGVVAEFNIPLIEKNKWDINFGFNSQSAYESKGSNTSSYSSYSHGKKEIFNQNNVVSYQDVTIVNDAKRTNDAYLRYSHINVLAGTSVQVKKIRLWIDAAYDFNNVVIRSSSGASAKVNFNQFTARAGVKIPLFRKIKYKVP